MRPEPNRARSLHRSSSTTPSFGLGVGRIRDRRTPRSSQHGIPIGRFPSRIDRLSDDRCRTHVSHVCDAVSTTSSLRRSDTRRAGQHEIGWCVLLQPSSPPREDGFESHSGHWTLLVNRGEKPNFRTLSDVSGSAPVRVRPNTCWSLEAGTSPKRALTDGHGVEQFDRLVQQQSNRFVPSSRRATFMTVARLHEDTPFRRSYLPHGVTCG